MVCVSGRFVWLGGCRVPHEAPSPLLRDPKPVCHGPSCKHSNAPRDHNSTKYPLASPAVEENECDFHFDQLGTHIASMSTVEVNQVVPNFQPFVQELLVKVDFQESWAGGCSATQPLFTWGGWGNSCANLDRGANQEMTWQACQTQKFVDHQFFPAS